MKKKLPLLLVLSLLCSYALLTFQKPEFTQQVPPTDVDRSTFVDFSKRICLLIGIGLFTTLVFGSTENQNGTGRFSSRAWMIGSFSVLGITTISVLIFNPIGAFTWNINRVANRDSRLGKPYLYNQLNSVPDIIFLGTSISYRIPAQEYAQRFSLTGFNFSVLGGTTVDYSTLTNFIVSKSTPDEKPTVIVTEVLSPGLLPSHNGTEYYKRYPIEYVEYMPLKFAFETLSTHLDGIFTFSSFSKIIYVEYFIRNKQWTEISTSRPDGTGITVSPKKDESTYKKAVAKVGKELDRLLRCDEVDADGKDAISKMVDLSKKQNISIIFYRSPINNDFYAITKKKPKIYKPCEEKFNRFMEQIQIENPNVFYVDLSHYAPISSGGMALYIDSHHPNSIGSNRVLEVLTPTIQKAIGYARSR
jgi:hypothetical protein